MDRNMAAPLKWSNMSFSLFDVASCEPQQPQWTCSGLLWRRHVFRTGVISWIL